MNTDKTFRPGAIVLMQDIQHTSLPERLPEEDDEDENNEKLDESFYPSESENETVNKELKLYSKKQKLSEEKFIVSLSSLETLSVFCQECRKPANIVKMARIQS